MRAGRSFAQHIGYQDSDIGSGTNDSKEVRLMCGVREWRDSGITYGANKKFASALAHKHLTDKDRLVSSKGEEHTQSTARAELDLALVAEPAARNSSLKEPRSHQAVELHATT